MPERGRIGIFNRSYYEELLVVRVHPEFLAGQKLPRRLIGKNIWKERARDIRNVEDYLGNNGVVIRKFFLNVSKDEQKKRFLERLEKPEKNWKFSLGDLKERRHWDDYMDAYEEAIRGTATDNAPWYVVPADNKWFTRVVVAGGGHRRPGFDGSRLPRGHGGGEAGLSAWAEGATRANDSLPASPPRLAAGAAGSDNLTIDWVAGPCASELAQG